MKAYEGDRYWDLDELEAFCWELQQSAPDWVRCEQVGTSRQGRPILLVTVGERRDGDPGSRPAFWLDGGTHCAEWTGIMGCVYTLSRWVEGLLAGETDLIERFSRSTALVMPCISPDGFHAMREGAPFLRSTLRPPRDGRVRVGLDPQDVDGDGVVRWMRWKHPAGPWIFDAVNPMRMRHRRLDDDPEDAYMVCSEGMLLAWDGVEWTSAAREFGLDLNRNFPVHWEPFAMFGMDAGLYTLSEPESRAVVDSFAAHPRIGAGLSNHTYSGCLLTQPYREPSPLAKGDIALMERLADAAVEGTGYPVFKVVPEFSYDKDRPIIGVWADAMSTTFGVPGYTLELWDPYGYQGVEVDNPAAFFERPDIDKVGRVLDGFHAQDPDCVRDWVRFEHPQLGEVEIGGFDYQRTVRNPPERLLKAELDKGFAIAERLLTALPRVKASMTIESLDGGLRRVRVVFENHGFLGTSSARARELGTAPPVVATLCGPSVQGEPQQELGWLAGWGDLQGEGARHPLYPALPVVQTVRTSATWIVPATGAVEVRWDAGRGGSGTLVG